MTGLLVPTKWDRTTPRLDEKGLVSALSHLLTEKRLREEMGRRGAISARRFSEAEVWRGLAEALEATLDDCCIPPRTVFEQCVKQDTRTGPAFLLNNGIGGYTISELICAKLAFAKGRNAPLLGFDTGEQFLMHMERHIMSGVIGHYASPDAGESGNSPVSRQSATEQAPPDPEVRA